MQAALLTTAARSTLAATCGTTLNSEIQGTADSWRLDFWLVMKENQPVQAYHYSTSHKSSEKGKNPNPSR